MTAYTSMHFRCHERLEARLVSLPRRRRALGQILRAFMATRWSEGCCYSCVAFFSMRPVRCSPRPPAKHEELKEESEGLTEPLPEKPSSVHSFNPCAPVFNPGAQMHYFDIDWRVPASPDLDLYWQYWGPSQPLDSSRKVRHHPRPPQTASIAVVCVRTSLVCVCVNEDTVPRTTPTRLQDLAETWNAETLSMRRGP